jgi:hypothetical protein
MRRLSPTERSARCIGRLAWRHQGKLLVMGASQASTSPLFQIENRHTVNLRAALHPVLFWPPVLALPIVVVDVADDVDIADVA